MASWAVLNSSMDPSLTMNNNPQVPNNLLSHCTQPGYYPAMTTAPNMNNQQAMCPATQPGYYPAMPIPTNHQMNQYVQPGNYQAMGPAPNMNHPQAMSPSTQPGYYPAMPVPTNHQMNQYVQPWNYQSMPPSPNNPKRHYPQLGNYSAMTAASNNQTDQQQYLLNNQQAMGHSTHQLNYSAMPAYTPQTTNSLQYSQTVQQMTKPVPVQTKINYPEDNQQQFPINDSCIVSVSNNFLLKFILRGNELKGLRNGQSCSKTFNAANPFIIEIDPDCNLTFKQSNNWESFDIIYAFAESKDMAYSLGESPHLSFLTPFRPTCDDDEDVKIHCKIIAYPRYATVDQNQNMGNYKNEKVGNFIRKGIIPEFDVDMALEIIGEAKRHECKALTILCMKYLMEKTTEGDDLAKISKAARENHMQLLQEKCLIEFEKCSLTEKENKSGKNEITKKGKK